MTIKPLDLLNCPFRLIPETISVIYESAYRRFIIDQTYYMITTIPDTTTHQIQTRPIHLIKDWQKNNILQL